ncbi:MAG: bifunctional aldolase/short-chain dehydrogenase [Rhodospirillaceae bacterium]|nr:bifunctional aldolase/short-chain dehydrogenase [Rhodospirillaceae bacterium]
MKSLWNSKHARAAVQHYGNGGVPADLALRVYSTRLLGSEPKLVLHGGGNTSLKTTVNDMVGDEWRVLCVKGSGWDMATIEPPGLPAVKLSPLVKARAFTALSDEDMVKLQRANLIDPTSPNPSVETLLHAFLPHVFIDHTHSTAILSIVDQPNGQELCREIFGDSMGIVPYVMPGFELAKIAAKIYESDPAVEGLILDKHGIFTFAETAEESYDRMIRHVSTAETRIARGRKRVFATAKLPAKRPALAEVAPILRGAVAEDLGAGKFTRFVLEHRSGGQVDAFVNGKKVADYGTRGVSTPDLVIRTKQKPLITIAPALGPLESFRNDTRSRVANYVADYEEYFRRCDALDKVERTMLDCMPRVAFVPGCGLFGIGRSAKDAMVAADIAEICIEAVIGAERIGRFEPLPEEELFKLEYWSLEQAKLKSVEYKPLSGQIAVITGGAGTIGAAAANLFANAGAHVAVLDIDRNAARATADFAGNCSIGLSCDVTRPDSVKSAFKEIIEIFGGLDILISNAGAAWQGEIGSLDDEILRKSFELNFFAHQTVAQAAVRTMLVQGTGGTLLFNTSKQAVNPGRDFGAYGLPKAATLFLSRQYALEYGKHGIRSNAVNADRIRSGLLTDSVVRQRSKARGLSEEDYLAGNLLGLEVMAAHVGRAFLDQALAERTTGNVVTVDGGNIDAALR